MNELKQENVKKALELCNTSRSDACKICPYHEFGALCHTKRNADALALLREKDARIKELEEAQGAEFTCFVGEQHKVDHCPYGDEIVRLQKEVAEKDAEIERLTAYNANLICANTDITNRHKDYLEEAERIARADAITEFAERLKTFYKHLPGNTVGGAVEYHIDQIAKEMKGVKDDIKKSQEAT